MSEPQESVVKMFVLYPDDLAQLEAKAQRIGEVLGLKRVNHSDAVRRMIRAFDVEAWSARNTAPPEPQRD